MGILPEIFDKPFTDGAGLKADTYLPAGPKEWAKLKKLRRAERKGRRVAGRTGKSPATQKSIAAQPRVPAGSPAGGQFTASKHSASDVLARIKASPQFAARQGEDHDEHWDKYAARWGVAGQEFHSVQVDTDTLLKMADTGSLGISRHRSEEEITKKQAGESPINLTIISRPPNERAPVFVLDGTHSMAAQIRNHQTASRKNRDKYSKTHVIISTEAAAIMGIPIPDSGATSQKNS